MKRRSAAAVERVAMFGDPNNRTHNAGLVRGAGRRRPELVEGRAQEGDESPPSCVKKVPTPVNPHSGDGIRWSRGSLRCCVWPGRAWESAR
jgi:hypothetical protein